jgi:two-component system, OmpR family, alkaline phosphatase synthesis response regulator PhoP
MWGRSGNRLASAWLPDLTRSDFPAKENRVPPKILIVDDEAHLRTLIQQTLEELEDEGVELQTASNGEEALEAIAAGAPNLMFLDVMMPKLSGFDVCSRVKQTLGLKDVYIVLLTAKGQEFDKQRGLEVGADLYMTKPFDPDALLAKARTVLGL